MAGRAEKSSMETMGCNYKTMKTVTSTTRNKQSNFPTKISQYLLDVLCTRCYLTTYPSVYFFLWQNLLYSGKLSYNSELCTPGIHVARIISKSISNANSQDLSVVIFYSGVSSLLFAISFCCEKKQGGPQIP